MTKTNVRSHTQHIEELIMPSSGLSDRRTSQVIPMVSWLSFDVSPAVCRSFHCRALCPMPMMLFP
jgi:hypothetical protein